MKRLAIIGSGDLAKQILHFAIEDKHYEVVGFLDDFELVHSTKYGLPILGKTKEAILLFENGLFDEILIGIGYNHIYKKIELYDFLKDKIPFGRIIHSTTILDKTAKIDAGTIIYPGCIIDAHVNIGPNTVLNIGCSIAHDSTIGQGCFLSPNVKIAGFTNIMDGVVLGIGSVIIDNITIGNFVKIGAGSVVIDSIEKSGLYVGVPAKFKKELTE